MHIVRGRSRISAPSLIVVTALIASLSVLGVEEASAHAGSGDMTYGGGCGAGISNGHDSWGGHAATTYAGLSSGGCTNMYVSITWYTGWGYASCSKTSGSYRTVSISTSGDSACPNYSFVSLHSSGHKLKKTGSTTWSSTCKLSHGQTKSCRY